MKRNADDDRHGHQRQKERPGVEEEKQCVRAVKQKGDRQREPVAGKACHATGKRPGRFFLAIVFAGQHGRNVMHKYPVDA